MRLLLHSLRHGYNIDSTIFLPALKLYDSSYTVPEKIQVKFSSQKMLKSGENEIYLAIVLLLFYASRGFLSFFVLSFVRMFSGILYIDPKDTDK